MIKKRWFIYEAIKRKHDVHKIQCRKGILYGTWKYDDRTYTSEHGHIDDYFTSVTRDGKLLVYNRHILVYTFYRPEIARQIYNAKV